MGSLPNLGTPKLTINSGDAGVHYCGFAATQAPGVGTFPGTDCGSASSDLTTPLTTYNPGWSAPIGTSHWIGPTSPDAPSNEYRARPGSYEFVASFNIPTGATSIALQLQVKSDNAVVAYVNGGKIGQNQFLQDCPKGGTCNWTVVLNMDDVGHGAYKTGPNPADANILRVDLVNTTIGLITDGVSTPSSTCADGPQLTGVGGVLTQPDHAAGGNSWDPATCLNPAGLDFVANVFWTPPAPPIPLFVIGDVEDHGIGDVVNFWGAQWWKNNQMSGETDPGYESFKGFASSADNFCGGQWSTEPGNSSDPPETIPADVAIIVTSKVLKNGNVISGDIKQIVIVHQDGNYQDNPGHAGGGPVTQIVCP